MFYRVDYVVALVVLGLVGGVTFGLRVPQWDGARLARRCFWFIAGVLILGRIFTAARLLLNFHMPHALELGIAGVLDLTKVALGSVIGLALVFVGRPARPGRAGSPAPFAAFFGADALYWSLRIVVAISFMGSALAKAEAIPDMTQFFNQSGYSARFLEFIIQAEALGALGLLIPETAIAATAGLSVIMVGAIATHLHNADGLDDDAGAVAMLFWLATIAGVAAFRRHQARQGAGAPPRLVRYGAWAVGCALLAVAGSVVARHHG